jgi:hypothetical protein
VSGRKKNERERRGRGGGEKTKDMKS